MARKLRLAYEGAMYHVSVRGNEKRDIFLTDGDRLRFLDQLSEQAAKHQVRLFQYCLMDNHFHLLIETPLGNISRFMQSLNTAYTVYFNKKHQRVGHLFQGRFHSKGVAGDGYLLQLSRYIHLNPVETDDWQKQSIARRLQFLKEYRWSSYPAYLGLADPIEGLEIAPVMALVTGHRRKPVAYQHYLQRGLSRTDTAFNTLVEGSAIGIGDEEFQASLLERGEEHLTRLKRPEDTTFRQHRPTFTPDEVIQAVADTLHISQDAIRRRSRGQPARSMTAYLMSRHCGMSQRDIAAHMGLGNGSSVSWQSRRCRRHLDRHPGLRRQLEQAEKRLRRRSTIA